MFNQKRIKELETKVDLILDHLGLEYLPRLVKKDIPKYTDYINSAKQTMDIKVDDLVAVKNEKISEKIPKGMKETICKGCGETFIQKKKGRRVFCDICKLRRLEQCWTNYERKNPSRQTTKTKGKNCKGCGKMFIVNKSSHRMYCDECRKIKRLETARKSSKKYEMKKRSEITENII